MKNLPQIGFSFAFQVAAVPTFLFFRNGKIVKRVEGAKAADVTKTVKALAKQKSGSMGSGPKSPTREKAVSIREPSESEEDLNQRLKKLTHSSPIMLFMKGDPAAPKCGFSRQTVELLNSLNAKFGSFDILSDEAVRQGLKTFSNWPTYPQLYIKGELVGGLDILKELNESGELKAMIDEAIPQSSSSSSSIDFKALVNRAPVMVFMKGSPSEPRCGFSRTLIEILNATGIKYETFDILSDDNVRQGLKKFSNWPTYPQVYVKGDLIGGLDIVKELKESGDLIPTLKGEIH